MKSTAIALTTLSTVALAGCGLTDLPLTGETTTEIREVEEFSSIDFQGAGDVVVIVGGDYRVEVTADSGAQQHIDVETRGGELVVTTHDGWLWAATDIDVAISVPELEKFDLHGAGNVVIRGIDSDNFVFNLDGAGDVSLRGGTGDALLSLDGAGDIDARQLVATDLVVTLAGAGDIVGHATQTLDATIDGVGEITYLGDPVVTKHIDGVGSISAE